MVSSLRVHRLLSAHQVFFRVGGRRMVTVVAKVTFDLTPDAVGRLVAPEPIAHRDRFRDDDPVEAVACPSDTAPILPRAEIVLSRDVDTPGTARERHGARFGLFRQSEAVLDKSAASDSSNARRVPGFGALGRAHAERSKLLVGLPRQPGQESAEGEFPESFPWEYFQCAPRDQQVSSIQGGDWLVLQDFCADAPLLRFAIPFERPSVRLDPGGGGAELLPCAPDLLVVRVDERRATLTFRTRPRVALDRVESVVVGLARPGDPPDFSDVHAVHGSPASPLPFVAPLGGDRGVPLEKRAPGRLAPWLEATVRAVQPARPGKHSTVAIDLDELDPHRALAAVTMNGEGVSAAPPAWVAPPVVATPAPLAALQPPVPPQPTAQPAAVPRRFTDPDQLLLALRLPERS